MNKERIAVGVDQNGGVWNDHFGESPFFNVYDGEGIFVEAILNPYGSEGDLEKKHGNPFEIVELLKGCGVLIGRVLGQGKKIERTGIVVFETKEDDPELAVKTYLEKNREG